MARSKRKTPICGFSKAKSDKYDKQLANRAYRKINKQMLGQLSLEESHAFVRVKHEVHNPAAFAKDGKAWFGHVAHRSPCYFNKLMRK